ncbi:MAG: hypothetical protein ACK5Y2_02695 [Bdellovibrionales bacterium]
MKQTTTTPSQAQMALKNPSFFSSSALERFEQKPRGAKPSVEDEFLSSLALVEDLHNRFRFMIGELRTSGLKVDE